VLHWQLPRQQMCCAYISLGTFMTHTSCSFRLSNNPIWASLDGGTRTETRRYCLSTATQEPWEEWNKNTLIHCTGRHLLPRFSVANGNKQISDVCRTTFEIFIQLHSMTKKSYKC
jgi:hypothetical protein